MRYIPRLLIALLVLPASLTPLTLRGDQAPPAATEPEALAREIAALIRQLGSDSFQEREQASQKLVKIGRAAQKQLEAASKSDDAEVARRAASVLDEFRKQDLGRTEVHVVGLYEAGGGKAVVEVRETKKPIILVLCAYEGVTWSVQAKEGVQILQVIASGYHKQTVEGVKAPVSTFSYDEQSRAPDGRPFFFYSFQRDKKSYQDMANKVRQLTEREIDSFQGRYSYDKAPFVIGAEK